MSIFGSLFSGSAAPALTAYLGERGDAAWRLAADVETTLQANLVPSYSAIDGCLWSPDAPDLKVDQDRRREVISGTLLVPISVLDDEEVTLSIKDRWKDAANIIWKPQTISDPIHGFRHVTLTKEARQFSGTVKR